MELLDQTSLPHKEEWLVFRDYREVVKAIKDMKVRGAPILGVVGAMSIYLAYLEYKGKTDLDAGVMEAFNIISSARPTARELALRAKEVLDVIINYRDLQVSDIFEVVEKIATEGYIISSRMIAQAFTLLKPRSRVLTHCNSGSLAVMGEGTALGVIKEGYKRGLVEVVYINETRPLLQGSRLTSYELKKESIPYRVIVDSSAPYLMSKGLVDIVIVGADRISMKGDVANKIGTYSLAVSAAYNGIPFIVVAPSVTFDPSIREGNDIIIEERDESEVLYFNGNPVAPSDSRAVNYAFDVTPHQLITAIVTEEKIIYPSSEGRL